MASVESPVRLDSVHKTYGSGESAVEALSGVSFGFPAGSFTAVMGPSGSGKSTLLHCAAGLDEPTSGRVTLVGTDLGGKSETALTELRREHVAFIFQSFNLMPALNVEQNVTLPMLLAGREPDRAWVDQVIARVGLSQRVKHRPGELSGGQQQRVAIARALAARPTVVFADEPTGALDTNTALEVLNLMRELVAAGQTIVMVTHDPVAASFADTVLFLVDGRIVMQLADPGVEAVASTLAKLGAQAKRARGQR
ncbi:ABC transporter ATP-binding protein [Saccharothrix longispora]|uniref:ABC transport system ATP-binding protein n=1 Tax=Saccharothrix longispora TaxID=33920 RepID=A0ABU1PVD5_9PSEU|nr:ABC transporter ATP-binding protein [Saccharothrix longispora]MDR6594605.1 putative ABC transport system ATP-binding protein [Saccharothrix longispora]